MFDFIFSALGTLFGFAVKAVASVVSVVATTFDTKRVIPSQILRERDTNFDKLHELNEEIEYLKRQQYKSSQEVKRLNSLLEGQTDLKNTISKQREVLAADKFISDAEHIEDVTITEDNVHILQWNAFADVVSKKCPRCSRLMKIQWSRNPQDMVQPFWACTGYYNNQICTYKTNMRPNELQLLTNTSAPEHSLNSDDFKIILEHPKTRLDIIERVSDLIVDKQRSKEGVDFICCPIHGEPMILSEKRNDVKGLLDMYHLKCPHHFTGCGYTEKLKSGGQLAALLKHETGRGIL